MFKIAISAALSAAAIFGSSHVPSPKPWTCARNCPVTIVIHGHLVKPVFEYKGGGIQ